MAVASFCVTRTASCSLNMMATSRSGVVFAPEMLENVQNAGHHEDRVARKACELSHAIHSLPWQGTCKVGGFGGSPVVDHPYPRTLLWLTAISGCLFSFFGGGSLYSDDRLSVETLNLHFAIDDKLKLTCLPSNSHLGIFDSPRDYFPDPAPEFKTFSRGFGWASAWS